jgi:basic membrane protein A
MTSDVLIGSRQEDQAVRARPAHGRLRKPATLAVSAVLAVAAAGCSSSSSAGAGAPSSSSPAKSSIKVGVVMSGPSNDHGFYQAGADGLKKAEHDFGVKGLLLENVAPPDGEQAFRNLVSQRANLVIGMGAEFEDAGHAVAPTSPNTQFAVMNARAPLANMATYQLREAQVASLGAYATALVMPPGTKFGLVAGVQIPPHLLLRDAVKRSLQLANPSDEFVSTFTGDFNDTAKAREAALAEVHNGAKVVLPWSGSAVDGALQAARDSNVKAISPLVDRCGRDSSIVTSAIADPGGLVYRIIKEYVTKTFKPGGSERLGLDNPDVVHVVSCSPLSAANQQKVDAFKQQLIAGTVPGMPQGV